METYGPGAIPGRDRRGGGGTWRMTPPRVRRANAHQTASNRSRETLKPLKPHRAIPSAFRPGAGPGGGRSAQELSLETHEGVPLASRTALPWGDGVCAVYADASGEQGWMAWSVHQGELLFADGVRVWDDAVRKLPICDKELLASTWGLMALTPARRTCGLIWDPEGRREECYCRHWRWDTSRVGST